MSGFANLFTRLTTWASRLVKRPNGKIGTIRLENSDMHLTEKERTILAEMIRNCASGCYDAEYIKEDNMTFTDVKEMSEITGMTKETVKGVMGSLIVKGLVVPDINPTTGQDEQVLSDRGIDIAFPIYEEKYNG